MPFHGLRFDRLPKSDTGEPVKEVSAAYLLGLNVNHDLRKLVSKVAKSGRMNEFLI